MPSYGPNNIIISSKPLLINHYESIRVGINEKVTFTGVIDQSNTTVQIKAENLDTTKLPNNYNYSVNFMVIGGGGGGGGAAANNVYYAGSGGGGGANVVIQYPFDSYANNSFKVDTVGNGGVGQFNNTGNQNAGFDGGDTKLILNNGASTVLCEGGGGGMQAAAGGGGGGGDFTISDPSGRLTKLYGGGGGDGGQGSNQFPNPGYTPPTSENIPPQFKGKSSQFGIDIDTGYTGTYKIPLLNNSDNSNFIYGGCGGGGGGGWGPSQSNPEQSSGGIPGGGNVSPGGRYFPYTYSADGLISGVGRGGSASVYGGGGGGSNGSSSVPGDNGGDGKQGIVVFWFVLLIPLNSCTWNPDLSGQSVNWSRANTAQGCVSVEPSKLDERRKAEIFKYKNNSANFSRKQNYARFARGFKQRGQTFATQTPDYTNSNIRELKLGGVNGPLLCKTGNTYIANSRQNNVPGPTTNIAYDPTVPLTRYVTRRTYSGGSEKWPQYGPNTGQARLAKWARNTGTKPGMFF